MERHTQPVRAPQDGDEGAPTRALSSEEERERELIARVRAGDREAFGGLVDLHLPHALSLAFRVLRHREDAEDLVQDALLAALEHIDAFDTRRAFWPWLSRIIVNRGLDLAAARSVRVTEPLPETLSDAGASPAALAERREILARFRHELALLPPRQQLIVQLVELDGYTVAEIAELLSSSPSTVRWHLHTGRHRLQEALAPLRGDGR